MTTIWKTALEITDRQEIKMPVGAKILSVQMQKGVVCLWYLFNSDLVIPVSEDRVILIAGTGNPFTEQRGPFIGTIQQAGGALVWHVFEGKEQ